MSDFSPGPGWWQASDLKWYPPEQVPGPEPTDAAPTAVAPDAPDWGAPAATNPWGTDVSSTSASDWGSAPASPDPGAAATPPPLPGTSAPTGGAFAPPTAYGPPGGAPGSAWPPAPGAVGPTWPASPGYGPPTAGPAFGGVPGYQSYGAYPAGYGSGPSVQGLATASLVLGIMALLFFWCWFFGIPLAVIGLPLGLVARSRIAKGQADPGPNGLALAGVICSGIALLGAIGVLALIFAN